MVKGIDHRQRQLALCHIIACGFAYFRRVVIVEYIVANLEDHTQILSELLGFGNVFFRGIYRQRTHTTAGLEQGGSLLSNYLIINVFREFCVVNVLQLQDLARGQRQTQFRDILQDPGILRLCHMTEAGGEDIVAYEHCHLIII